MSDPTVSASPTPASPATVYRDYSAGSDVLPWKGWLEVDGAVVAFVDLAGHVWRHRDGEDLSADETPSDLATRTAAWNAVRDAAFHAARLPAEPSKTDFWPLSGVACLVSLVMKEIGRHIGSACDPQRYRLKAILDHMEAAFAVAVTFSLTDALPSEDEAIWSQIQAGKVLYKGREYTTRSLTDAAGAACWALQHENADGTDTKTYVYTLDGCAAAVEGMHARLDKVAATEALRMKAHS